LIALECRAEDLNCARKGAFLDGGSPRSELEFTQTR
jgi:hypothetical protein